MVHKVVRANFMLTSRDEMNVRSKDSAQILDLEL